MPAGRCATCAFLCNRDLIGCEDPDRPCPREDVCYCSHLCQERDEQRHRDRFHGFDHRRADKEEENKPSWFELVTHEEEAKAADYAALLLLPCPEERTAQEKEKVVVEKASKKVQEPKSEQDDVAAARLQQDEKIVEVVADVAVARVEQAEEEEEIAVPPVTTAKTKKSRLEMKREARRSKKAARKVEKKALMNARRKREEAGREEQADLLVQPPAEEEMVPDSSSILGSGEPTSPRRMTKKEKKREERRLQNVQRKAERQRLKQLGQREERQKKRREAEEMAGKGDFLAGAVAITKLIQSSQETEEEEEAELFSVRRDCYLGLGKARQALEDARRAVNIRKKRGGDTDQDLLKLLRIQILVGSVAEASETLSALPNDDLSQERSDLQSAKDSLGAVEEALASDNWHGALEAALKAERFCPHSPALSLARAEVQAHLGMYKEAKMAVARRRVEKDEKEDARIVFVDNIIDYYSTPWWQEEKREPR